MTFKENLDVEEYKKVQQLSQRFINVEMPARLFENTFAFYRFLKARNFDIDQAELMIRKCLEWRKKLKIDQILTEEIFCKEIDAVVPETSLGYDKEDAPIKYVSVGNADIKGLHKSVKFIDRMRYFAQLIEDLLQDNENQCRKIGKIIEGVVFILDMKNFSFANATDKQCAEDVINLIRIVQDNYPERLKALFIINTSIYFSIGYAMVKNFIASSILSKIEIYGSEDDWKPALLRLIDADTLPAFLGGNRTDPDGDPMCKSFVKHGGKIPTHLYSCKSKSSLSKCKDVKKLILPRASFNEIELEVNEAGSIIEWEFEIKCRDIGFGVFLKETDAEGEEKITELVPLVRLDTEAFSEAGRFKCEKAGTYVILFDNSYSWVRSKEIYYRASVLTQKQHESEITS